MIELFTNLSAEWLILLSALFAIIALLAIVIYLLIAQRRQYLQTNQTNLEQAAEKQAEQDQFIDLLQQSWQQQNTELNHSIAQQFSELKLGLFKLQSEQSGQQNQQLQHNQQALVSQLHQHQQKFSEQQAKALDQLVEHLTLSTKHNREELAKSLQTSSEQMTKQIELLADKVDLRLKEISGQVDKRLADSFEKTTKTFSDILQRLALIDDAQKKITELSSNVVSLQEVLADKRSRGAFGEVQLNSLIRNVLPEQHFSIQHTLSNGKVADCVLFLPKPTGNVVIDSKFPLESYRIMTDEQAQTAQRLAAQKQFKQDIKKHINDISTKYLIEHETSDGAIMFIPAESVFAEIHGHHSDLVDYANQKRVWLASPTTLMAILTTARSVLKDEVTRKQVHIIQQHLAHLSADFGRFRSRFDNLSKRLEQASTDIKQIHTSADKIADRFVKIEQVELEDEMTEAIVAPKKITEASSK